MVSKKSIIEYLAEGRIEDAIEVSIKASEKAGNRVLLKESLVIANRFKEIEQRKIHGSLDNEYLMLEKNKIRKSIIDLAAQLGDTSSPVSNKKSNIFSLFISWISNTFRKVFA